MVALKVRLNSAIMGRGEGPDTARTRSPLIWNLRELERCDATDAGSAHSTRRGTSARNACSRMPRRHCYAKLLFQFKVDAERLPGIQKDWLNRLNSQ